MSGENWLKAFLPSATEVQTTIYLQWLESLRAFARVNLGFVPQDDWLLGRSLRYFFPRSFLLSSPYILPDFQTAMEIMRAAISHRSQNMHKIVLFGDRDADGISSSAIVYKFLRDRVSYPDSHLVAMHPLEDDRYGLTSAVCERILAHDPDLLIVFDCGSSNAAEIGALRSARPQMQIIILDHHFLPSDESDFPPVEAFINPKRLPVAVLDREMCTAGLALQFIRGLLWSHSAENGITNELLYGGDRVLVRDGVILPVDSVPADRTIDLEAGVFRAAWESTRRSNSDFFRLAGFLEKFPEAMDTTERFRVIQNLHRKTMYEATRAYLPIAAMGTMADLMPLADNNRIFVSEGTAWLREPRHLTPGVAEMLRVFNLYGTPVNETDLSFTLCPALNAPGRMGVAHEAFEALVERDPLLARQRNTTMRQRNDQRKKASANSLDLLLEAVHPDHDKYGIGVAYHPEVHRGISGLAASRLAEALQKPVVVLVDDGDVLRGSFRAWRNENVYAVLKAVSEHTVQFGGHRQAAGFSLIRENIDLFREAVYRAAGLLQDNGDDESSESFDTFRNPIPIPDSKVARGLWNEIAPFSPFGMLNPHPTFLIESSGARIEKMGSGDHARLHLNGLADRSIETVWFFHGGEADLVREFSHLRLFTEPHLNMFQGRLRYQLKVRRAELGNPDYGPAN